MRPSNRLRTAVAATASATSAVIAANYMLAFGNFRNALVPLEQANEILPKSHNGGATWRSSARI